MVDILRFFRLLLIPLLLLWAASASAAGESPATAPGVRISPDDPASLQAGIDAAYMAGLKKVVVPPGVYHVSSNQAYLRLENMSDFEIDAEGVTMLRPDPRRMAILIDHCHNLTLQGMTLLNQTPPFTQAIIQAIDPAGKYYDLTICPGYPANFDDPRSFPEHPTGYIFDPHTRQWKAGTTDLWAQRVERLGPGRFRLFWNQPAGPDHQNVAVGDEMAFRGNGGTDIYLPDCDHVTLVGLVIRNGCGFCVHESDGEGYNHYSYTVTYGPRPAGASEDPLIASNADAFHSNGMRHGPTLDNCHFEGMPDDGVAIHGVFSLAVESDGPSLVALFEGADFFRPGDPLRLFDKTGQWVGSAVVKAAEPIKDYQPRMLSKRPHYRKTHRYFRLTLDRPLNARFDDLIDDPNANGSGYVVRNCVIRNHRARGMLLKADDGLVENNLIDGSTMAGIVLAPELYWNEAGYSQNVTLRGNTIRHVGYQNAGPWMPQPGAITVRGEGDQINAPGPSAKSVGADDDHLGHRHITIENNTIEDCDGLNLLVSSASGVLIAGNRFIDPQQHASRRGADHVDPEALIEFGPCKDVQMEKNVVVHPGPFEKTLVKAANPALVVKLAEGVTVEKPSH